MSRKAAREKSEKEGRREEGGRKKTERRVARSGKRETRTKQRALKEETIFASREIKMSDTMKRGVFFNFAALMQPRLRFVLSVFSLLSFFFLSFSLSRSSTGPCSSNKAFISSFYSVPSFARRIHLHKIPAAISRCSRKRINFPPNGGKSRRGPLGPRSRHTADREIFNFAFGKARATNRIGDE